MRGLLLLVLLAVAAWFLADLDPRTARLKDQIEAAVTSQMAEQSAAPEADDDPSETNTSEDGDGFDDVAIGGAGDEQNLDQYRAWIREARERHPYPESEERMYAVMMCESGGDAVIVNPAGPYSGLFQYSPATWSGDWNTYRNEDILDPRAQIFATALAWSNGMQSQWGCYSRAH